MSREENYSAFCGTRNIATGSLGEVLSAVYHFQRDDNQAEVLIFDNGTGKQRDYNFQGTLEEVLENALPPEPSKGRGRPKLGVENGEISLLPRHWEWLREQPQKASGAIRRLVEQALKSTSPEEETRRTVEAAGRFMWTMAGNQIGFEEASRALYAGKWIIFDTLTAGWPEDVKKHLTFMLRRARNPFQGGGSAVEICRPLADKYKDHEGGNEPWELCAVTLAASIAGGSYTVVQSVDSHLRRIGDINPAIGAVTALFEEEARKLAVETDRKMASGETAGPLAGVPFTVKGNLDVKGRATTNGIPAMKDALASKNAPLVDRLMAAGAIPLGHTNLPDMSLRFHTFSQLYGATLNPWNRNLTPGGSSGGEGAAIAAGMSPMGIGNDAGGSLRIPASFNGIAALKPSYGRFPSDRSVGPRNMTLASQTIPVDGFLARSVADLHLLYQVAAGPDPRDPGVVPAPLFVEPGKEKIRVAVTTDPGKMGVEREVVRAMEKAAGILAEKGYDVEEAQLPHIREITEAYGKMIMTEFHQSLPILQRLLGPDGRKYIEFAMETQRPADLPGYLELTALRQGFRREWAEFFSRYPLVLGPVYTGEIVPPDYDIRGIDEYREVAQSMRLCSASSFIGVPAVAVPTGISDGIPRGVQLLAGMYREDLCLEAAAHIESAAGTFTPIDPR